MAKVENGRAGTVGRHFLARTPMRRKPEFSVVLAHAFLEDMSDGGDSNCPMRLSSA